MFQRNLDGKTKKTNKKKELITLFTQVFPLDDVFRTLSNIYGGVFYTKKVNG